MARPRGDIEPRILAAARARFLADGVDGASLRRIAREARTNIGMIYYYFPTKEDLFLAVVEETYARVIADLAAALAPGEGRTVHDRLHRMFVRLGQLSEDEIAVMRLVIREMLTSSERRGKLLERFMHGHVPLIVGTVLEGVQTGAFTDRVPPPVLAISTATLALFPQLIRQVVGERIPVAIGMPGGETLSHALADVLLNGIAKAPKVN